MDRQAVGQSVGQDRGTDRPLGVPSWFTWPDDEELELPDLDDEDQGDDEALGEILPPAYRGIIGYAF